MKTSAGIHLIPGELAPNLELAAQLLHHGVVALQPLLRVRVVGQPQAKLLIERAVLLLRAGAPLRSAQHPR